MKKILILGSEGFLGSALVPYLQKEKGIQITGVDKCFFGRNNKNTNKFNFFKKDYSSLPKKFFIDLTPSSFSNISINLSNSMGSLFPILNILKGAKEVD